MAEQNKEEGGEEVVPVPYSGAANFLSVTRNKEDLPR